MNRSVFISFKSEDIKEAKWLKMALESNGFSCWMAPENIPGGSNYAAEISGAIKSVSFFVLVLSNKTQDSLWVPKEIDLAINENKIILPFVIEDCVLKDEFKFYLTNVQCYYAFQNKKSAFSKLLNDINALAQPQLNESEQDKIVEVQLDSETLSSENNLPVKNKKTEKKRDLRYEVCGVISACLSIVGLVCLGMLVAPNIAAMILAVISLKNILKHGKSGKQLSLAGFILGSVATIIGLSIYLGVGGAVLAVVVIAVTAVFFVKAYKAVS